MSLILKEKILLFGITFFMFFLAFVISVYFKGKVDKKHRFEESFILLVVNKKCNNRGAYYIGVKILKTKPTNKNIDYYFSFNREQHTEIGDTIEKNTNSFLMKVYNSHNSFIFKDESYYFTYSIDNIRECY